MGKQKEPHWLTISEIKDTFLKAQKYVLSSVPHIAHWTDRNNQEHTIVEYPKDYMNAVNIAVDAYCEFMNQKCYPEGFSASMVRSALRYCIDNDFRLNLLNRVNEIIVAGFERGKKAFFELSNTANLYYFFEQDYYDISDNWTFWPVILGGTECCEYFLLPYISEEAFYDINSKRERLAYIAIHTLLEETSVNAYRFLETLLTSERASNLEPPWDEFWLWMLQTFFKSIGGARMFRETLFKIGNEWEELCYEIVSQNYTDLIRHPRLLNNSIPDIAVGTISRNEWGEIFHAERIIECKKSIYYNVVANEPTDNYAPYCDCLEFWVLEKESNPYFTFPRSENIRYIFASDLLKEPKIKEEYRAKVSELLGISNCFKELNRPQTVWDYLYVIDLFLEFPLEVQERFRITQQRTIEQTPKVIVRQYRMDGTFIKEFESVKLAAEEIGVRADTISYAINGRRNSAGGFLWRKCEADSPIENITPSANILDMSGKVIYQVDENGEVLATYKTMREAEKKTGVNHRSISDALKGIQKKAGGFTWVLGDKQ